jgi:hypothetical protein
MPCPTWACLSPPSYLKQELPRWFIPILFISFLPYLFSSFSLATQLVPAPDQTFHVEIDDSPLPCALPVCVGTWRFCSSRAQTHAFIGERRLGTADHRSAPGDGLVCRVDGYGYMVRVYAHLSFSDGPVSNSLNCDEVSLASLIGTRRRVLSRSRTPTGPFCWGFCGMMAREARISTLVSGSVRK